MTTTTKKINLLDLDRQGIRDFFAELGEKPFRADQVMKWVYHYCIERLYGSDHAQRIRSLHLCVIGLGGVGSWAAEGLARSGVGKLRKVITANEIVYYLHFELWINIQ